MDIDHVYAALLGKEVIVYTVGPQVLGGILHAYDPDFITLKLPDHCPGYTYMLRDKIVAIVIHDKDI